MSLSRPRRKNREEDRDGESGEDQRGPPPAKRLRPCRRCCQENKDLYGSQIEILTNKMECVSKGFETLQKEMQGFHQLMRERFNTLISSMERTGEHVQQNSNIRTSSDHTEITTYRMKFENRCCNDKYSRHDITADDGNPIKVAIYDRDNGIVTQGPLSCMQVKIVVLDGEFNNANKKRNRDYFRRKIVSGRTGKPSLFSENIYLRLENGVADLHGVKFQDNSSWLPSKKFKLGVMVDDDSIPEDIQQGISDSFAVKDGRGYAAKKDPSPSLTDPVYKLKEIAENGKRRKLLEQKGIETVQNFLWSYNKDKNNLRKDCGNISDHDWDVIVVHAQSCNQEHIQHSYYIQEGNATVLFNSLYCITGADFGGIYTSYENFNKAQKDLVKKYWTTAYDNLEVVQYEDQSASTEHEVIHGDKNSCNLRGSCSTVPTSSLSTWFPDEPSQQGKVLDSDPPHASPCTHQRWVKIVTTLTTLHFWKNMGWYLMKRQMLESPESNFAVTDLLEY